MRTLVFGDIHGNLAALEALIPAVNVRDDDRLVLLGDYIDRGPDSKGVVSRLIDLSMRHLVLTVRGNHEVMILTARTDPLEGRLWRTYGGDEALRSYGADCHEDWQRLIPAEHWSFFESTRPWFETDTHIFVHGSVLPDFDMDNQPEYTLYWERFDPTLRHKSGKTVVCGHTPQRSGWPARGPFSICLDTGAGHGRWLTCLDVESGQLWQANEHRELRTGKL
jgi:serine/threonine protein phosphatase 1